MDSVILKSFIPEIFLSVTILFNLTTNALLINVPKYNFPLIDKEVVSQFLFVLFVSLLLSLNNLIEGHFIYFVFANNLSVKIVKTLTLITSIICIFPIYASFRSQQLSFFEYFILFSFSILSTLLLISASDLLSFYLSVEMQSLCFFVLASFRRNSVFSSEAGLKYFVLGSFISGLLLFGCSVLFGSLGTLNFTNLKMLLLFPLVDQTMLYHNIVLFGSLCLTIVFLFKLAAAPFHFWMPDVYEGSPLASTIVFSLIPKFGIFYFFLKWLSLLNCFSEIKSILICSGLLSTLIGSLFALRQKRIKRLILYSSIAQIGFLIVGSSVFNLDGFSNVYFFLIVYVITSFLLWSFVTISFSCGSEVANFNSIKKTIPLFLSNLSNLFSLNQSWSLTNLFIFFSFAGVPPLLGFFAKFLVFFGLISSKYFWSSFWLLILSVVSVFYYLRVIKIIFFEKLELSKISSSQIIFNISNLDLICYIVSLFLLLLFFLFFFPSTLLLFANLINLNFF